MSKNYCFYFETIACTIYDFTRVQAYICMSYKYLKYPARTTALYLPKL